jgi:hypothetical protein
MAKRMSVVQFRHITFDLSVIILSILVAILLVKSHVIDDALSASAEFGHIGSFVAGMFFTSAFTTAPAIAALGEISFVNGIVETALWAALGAVVGDMIIFRFVRDRMANHLLEILPHKRGSRRLARILKFRFFRYITFLIGGIIIASPLPDELGISLLGLSKMRSLYFVPLSFGFNFLGICTIGLVAASSM